MDTIKLLSDITVFGKYAKYKPDKFRRETWDELCQATCDMHKKKYPQLAEGIQEIFDEYVKPKRVLPSMRSLQFKGKAIELSPNRGYNCFYQPINDYRAFSEAMFLLLGGSGVGISVQRPHVDALPTIKGPKERVRRFLISDNIEGWSNAVRALLESYMFNKMDIQFDFSDIRKKGSPLKTAGGKAPGPQPLKDCLHNIRKVLDSAIEERGETKLKPIECFDIICHISDAVLSGGIRRSAVITLFSKDDDEMLSAKSGDWWEENPQRGRSNNSVVLYRDSTEMNEFFKIWKRVQESGCGEPGIVWSNDIRYGVNPCAEISLRESTFCNLTEVDVSKITTQDELNKACAAASVIGTLQAGYTDFHYLRDIIRENTEEDSLIGVGMTGIGSGTILELDLKEASQFVNDTNKIVAAAIGINPAKRTTTIKPSGTSSLVVGSSSGVHAWHNDYYIRRMRLGKNEPLFKYLSSKAPQLLEDDVSDPTHKSVLSIPVKAPEGAILRTESAISLLERVTKFNTEWVANGHHEGPNKNNVSVTVSIKDHEWETVGLWMWAYKDTYTGISVLPYSDHTYKQAPFEDITKEQYDKMVASMSNLEDLDLTEIVEYDDDTDLKGESACAGGSCTITSV